MQVLPRLESALFIDFENLPLGPDFLPNWLAWLEDGRFHHGRRRRLALKRVYWNSTGEKYRERYEAAGFDVVLCEKFANRKNGADIRMAVDIVETIHTMPRVQEFILVTVDSDFVPVLQRLQSRGKRSVVLVDEERPDHHTICRRHADVLIPVRRLAEARQYRREPGRLPRLLRAIAATSGGLVSAMRWPRSKPHPTTGEPLSGSLAGPTSPVGGPPAPAGRVRIVGGYQAASPGGGATIRAQAAIATPPVALRGRASAEGPSEQPVSQSPQDAVSGLVAGAPVAGRMPTSSLDQVLVERQPVAQHVIDQVVTVLAANRGDFTGRSKVIAALRRMPGFKLDGEGRYFGYGSYRDLMTEIARQQPAVRVVETDGGGIGVILVADDARPEPATGPLVHTATPPVTEAASLPVSATAEQGESVLPVRPAGTASVSLTTGDAVARGDQAVPPPLRVVSNDR